ncbi:hypothetical protein V8F06_014798 [Rhypophila decipiens]
MTSSGQSSTVTPTPQDSAAWPPSHIWDTMTAADRASCLDQIRIDRARRLEIDAAESDLHHRRPQTNPREDVEDPEENCEPPPEVKPLIDLFPGISAALLVRVFERKLKATELIRFKEKPATEQDEEDKVFKITEMGGSVGFKKSPPSLKDWGSTPQVWKLLPHLLGNCGILIRP